MDIHNMHQSGGWARSPSTLVQLAVGSVPPVDPSFFNTIDGVADPNVPVPSNQMTVTNIGQVGGNDGYSERVYTEGYKEKYLKYKAKYLSLKKKISGGGCACNRVGGNCAVCG